MWLSGDCLPSKPKALNSIPSTTKKKKIVTCRHIGIPIIWEVQMDRITVQGQPGQNMSKTLPILTDKKLDMVSWTCHPSCGGGRNKIMVQAGPGQKHKTLLGN
jgi:hypothetical protein